jgi:chromosome partitioning protein
MGAPVIAVLNLKGGVGKTTVAAAVGRGFYDAKRRPVLLADLDPQFNLTQALQSEQQYDQLVAGNKTILTAFEPAPSTNFFQIKTSSSPPPSPETIERRLRYYIPQPAKRVALIAGNFELIKYSLLSDSTKLTAAKARFLTFIASARETYDVVILDCNPSSSFLTRCALEASTDVLIPVRPDKFSLLGVDLLDRFIDRLGMARRPRIHVLLNATSRSVLTEAEKLIRASRFGKDTLVSELYSSGLLIAKPGFHKFAVDRKAPYSATLKRTIAGVCAELGARIGL